MALIAKSYLNYKDNLITPGEIIEFDIDDKTKAWWIKAEAIEELPDEEEKDEIPEAKDKPKCDNAVAFEDEDDDIKNIMMDDRPKSRRKR